MLCPWVNFTRIQQTTGALICPLRFIFYNKHIIFKELQSWAKSIYIILVQSLSLKVELLYFLVIYDYSSI